MCDGKRVYFWQNYAELRAVPTDGGPSVLLATAPDPGDIAANDAGIYWVKQGLYTARDGAAVELVSAIGARVSADEDHIFWSADLDDGGSAILRTDIDGDATTLLWPGATSSGFGLSSSRLYWHQHYPNMLLQVALDGGPASSLVDGAAILDTLGPTIVADEKSVYWVAAGVWRVDVDGANVRSMLDKIPAGIHGDPTYVGAIAVDESSLYISINSSVPSGLACGGIVKVAK